jgi:hypothetical protein
VSDRQFCGGAPGDEEKALALLASAEQAKLVTVIPSIDEAMNRFTGKR